MAEEEKKAWGGTFTTEDLSNIDFQTSGESRTKVFNKAAEVLNKTAQDLKDSPITGKNKAEVMNNLRNAIAKNVDPKNPQSADNIFNFVSMNADFKDPNSFNIKRFVEESVPPRYRKEILSDIFAEQKDFSSRTGIEAPKTELVTPEGDKTSEVQTVTDTKDVRAVGDLEEENPSEHRELKGPEGKTTTTNYINQSEDENNVVNEKQVEAIWDKSKEKGEAPTEKELKKIMPEEAEPTVTTEKAEEPKEDKAVAKDKQIQKQIQNIRRGIWRDFNNGMFGNVFKGKKWSELTDEEKAQRSDAFRTAMNFTIDAIGSMFWNIGSAFGRKGEPYMDMEYAKLLRQQNEGLVQNEQYIREQQAVWDSLLSRSEQFKELPRDMQNSILSFLVTQGGDARNLSQSLYVDRIGEATTKVMEKEVDKLNAEVTKMLLDAGATKQQIELIKEEIKSAAINNKYLPERIEKTLTGMGIQNAKGILDTINTGMDGVLKLSDIAGSIVKAVSAGV